MRSGTSLRGGSTIAPLDEPLDDIFRVRMLEVERYAPLAPVENFESVVDIAWSREVAHPIADSRLYFDHVRSVVRHLHRRARAILPDRKVQHIQTSEHGGRHFIFVGLMKVWLLLIVLCCYSAAEKMQNERGCSCRAFVVVSAQKCAQTRPKKAARAQQARRQHAAPPSNAAGRGAARRS